MSAYLYDEALIESLRKVAKDPRITIVNPDLAIQFLAQSNADKTKFPAIVVSRDEVRLGDYKNQVAALKGDTAKINDDNMILKVRLIPMRIQWSINVFAVDRFTCDEIIRELVFYFTTYPCHEVKIPYNLDILQNFDVFVQPDIEDNSDLVEFQNRGEYFRETLTVFTENAHMYSSYEMYPTEIGKVLEVETTSDLNKLIKGDKSNA